MIRPPVKVKSRVASICSGKAVEGLERYTRFLQAALSLTERTRETCYVTGNETNDCERTDPAHGEPIDQ